MPWLYSSLRFVNVSGQRLQRNVTERALVVGFCRLDQDVPRSPGLWTRSPRLWSRSPRLLVAMRTKMLRESVGICTLPRTYWTFESHGRAAALFLVTKFVGFLVKLHFTVLALVSLSRVYCPDVSV